MKIASQNKMILSSPRTKKAEPAKRIERHLHTYYFPTLQKSVRAYTLGEAQIKVEELIKEENA